MINFTSLPSPTGKSGTKITEVLWKDTLTESRAYIHMMQKIAELYEHVLDKAQFFRKFIAEIFVSVPAYRFLSLDALFKGFFFIFVYKDFIVRELVQRVDEQLPQVSQRHILQQVEHDYRVFMETDLTCWVHILLHIDVFQSYNSIVAPNEAVRTNRTDKPARQPQSSLLTRPFTNNFTNDRGPHPGLRGESANFIALQKRYIKGFLAAYYRFNDQISMIPGGAADDTFKGQ